MVIKTEQYCKKMEVNLSSLPQSHAQRTHYDVRIGVSPQKKTKKKTKTKQNKSETIQRQQQNRKTLVFFFLAYNSCLTNTKTIRSFALGFYS